MRSLVVASVAALALSGLTGCQGGNEAAQDPTTGTPTPTAEDTTTPTAGDTPTPTAEDTTPTAEDTTTPTPDQTGEDYAQTFVDNFMSSCVASSGGMRKTCQCILDGMEAEFSQREATNLARKITAGGGLPKGLRDIILGCR